jgi:hypothetical protein
VQGAGYPTSSWCGRPTPEIDETHAPAPDPADLDAGLRPSRAELPPGQGSRPGVGCRLRQGRRGDARPPAEVRGVQGEPHARRGTDRRRRLRRAHRAHLHLVRRGGPGAVSGGAPRGWAGPGRLDPVAHRRLRGGPRSLDPRPGGALPGGAARVRRGRTARHPVRHRGSVVVLGPPRLLAPRQDRVRRGGGGLPRGARPHARLGPLRVDDAALRLHEGRGGEIQRREPG